MAATDNNSARIFYHGTRADLRTGDLIAVGYASNYGTRQPMSWVYFPRRWMRRSGARSWRRATGGSASISSSRPAPSSTTPT